ncbi:restriction endonuclease subunit S [Streptococcus mitis]|uniref:restriction endonuclease subunit S n=1 Tax=Streptococcus mitis TaxID=28037 RepID=UPI00066E22B9|nr:restriction endonuclease subunit S [Streptococcus mitis]
MTKQPSYRFAGYTESWEQKKLGAYLTVSKNRNVDGEYDKSDVLSVSGDYGIVNQIKFQGRSFAGASVLPYGIVETGDVVYTKSPLKANPYGIIKTNHGKNGIVSTLYAIYKVNNGSNGIFVEYYFDDNLRLNKYLKPLVNKGAKNDMKVTDENVLKGDVIFPSLPEQTAIGSFFQDIDQLISLQQRKLEVLKEQKKTYLKFLFPAKGQTKPALRFAGFEDEWKEVKLGESADYKNGKGYEDRQSDSGSYELINLNSISIDGGLKHSGKFIDKADETLEKGDLVMVLSDVAHGNLLGRVAIIPESNKFVLNQRVALLRPRLNSNSEFLYSYINSNQYYFKSQGAGMSQLNISRSSVENFSVYFPSLPEQEAIGSFFQDLDKAIAKQEEKVNQFKESKQTLLRKMFI